MVYLLIPENDTHLNIELPGIKIVKGPENDVLDRYMLMQHKDKGDYVCRITADCPLVPPFMITKAIMAAVKGPWDFITNAIPGFRTYPDGCDVEVMSDKLLSWINKNARGQQREHVTNVLWEKNPQWASMAHIFNHIDLSDLKFSVDTQEDFENVRQTYESLQSKIESWGKRYGPNSCHRF